MAAYGLEAVLSMEFLVPSLRIAAKEKLSMEESYATQIQQLLMLEEDKKHNILIAKTIEK